MERCFNCGISGENVRLFDAISPEGIVRLCRECISKEKFPLLKKPTTFQLKESEKEFRFKNYVEKSKKDFGRAEAFGDQNLRDIVDKNLSTKYKKSSEPRPDLIRNFHWIVMRARKNKKITQKQLAQEISESETAIKMAEKGFLPEDDNRLISKIESYLGINLRRKCFEEKEIGNEPVRILNFDPATAKNLTIADLREMKKKKEEFSEEEKKGPEPTSGYEEHISEEELSGDDIDF